MSPSHAKRKVLGRDYGVSTSERETAYERLVQDGGAQACPKGCGSRCSNPVHWSIKQNGTAPFDEMFQRLVYSVPKRRAAYLALVNDGAGRPVSEPRPVVDVREQAEANQVSAGDAPQATATATAQDVEAQGEQSTQEQDRAIGDMLSGDMDSNAQQQDAQADASEQADAQANEQDSSDDASECESNPDGCDDCANEQAQQQDSEQQAQQPAPPADPAQAALEQIIRKLARDEAGKLDVQALPQIIKTVQKMIADALENAPQSIGEQSFEVSVDGATPVRIDGIMHKQFEMLLRAMKARKSNGKRIPVWVAGPVGSGKTTAVAQAAKVLDLPFYCQGAANAEYKLTGFVDAQGRIINTPFRKCWTNGGVFLWDECDGSSHEATLPFNSALANGFADFPGCDEPVYQHDDCYVVVNANTWGHGATAETVGRLQLDGAFLDRFIDLDWQYDDELEQRLTSNVAWCKTVQQYRKAMMKRGLQAIISPRATEKGAALLAAGFNKKQAVAMTMSSKMPEDTWKAIQSEAKEMFGNLP